MISRKDIEILRLIVRAGDDYSAVKRLLAETRWQIEQDDVDLGFLRIFISDAVDECYKIIIDYRDPDHPPYSLLTFSLFPDSQEHLAAFNAAFHSAAETLTRYFGPPMVSGDHQMSFLAWPYAYQRWSRPETEFTLVQDAFDIQDGMNVTLWAQTVGTSIEKALHL